MFINSGNDNKPDVFIGQQALKCMDDMKIEFSAVPLGQILVEPENNRAFGIHQEPIHDKDNFAVLVLRAWLGKRMLIIIFLLKKAQCSNNLKDGLVISIIQPLDSKPNVEGTPQERTDNGSASNSGQEANTAIVAVPSVDDGPLDISEVTSQVNDIPDNSPFESDDELSAYIKKKVPVGTENSTRTCEFDIVHGKQSTLIDEQETQRVRKATSSSNIQQLSSMFEIDDDDVVNLELHNETPNVAREVAQTGDGNQTQEEEITDKGYDVDMFDEDDVSNFLAQTKALPVPIKVILQNTNIKQCSVSRPTTRMSQKLQHHPRRPIQRSNPADCTSSSANPDIVMGIHNTFTGQLRDRQTWIGCSAPIRMSSLNTSTINTNVSCIKKI